MALKELSYKQIISPWNKACSCFTTSSPVNAAEAILDPVIIQPRGLSKHVSSSLSNTLSASGTLSRCVRQKHFQELCQGHEVYCLAHHHVQHRIEIAKVFIWGDFRVVGVGGWGGLNMGRTLYVFPFSCIPSKVTSMQNFIDIE